MNEVGKAYLESIRRMDRRIMMLTSKKNALESCLLPGAIRYDRDKVQTSPEDKTQIILAEVLELEKKIDNLRWGKSTKIHEVYDTIQKLKNEDEREVLTYYYVDKKDINDIAKMMHYSAAGIYGLRSRGCNNIVKFIPTEKEKNESR
jgi:DNA-directed RNA polymerase specialized sigma subunit